MTARRRFEQKVLPHLHAAYNLARWLLRDDSAAEDAVQEASIKAFRYIDSLRGDDARPWFLGIVRNCCFTALERSRKGEQEVEFDSAGMAEALAVAAPSDPAADLGRSRMKLRIDAAIRALTPPLREVIVLRELEELDYATIAQIAGVPVGTVMSRLARAREKLRNALADTRMDH
jgi:RNA polymerase sigma factor (sigma-70 family)